MLKENFVSGEKTIDLVEIVLQGDKNSFEEKLPMKYKFMSEDIFNVLCKKIEESDSANVYASLNESGILSVQTRRKKALIIKKNKSKVEYHTIEMGESLRYISQIYGICLEKIIEKNEDATLGIGYILCISCKK